MAPDPTSFGASVLKYLGVFLKYNLWLLDGSYLRSGKVSPGVQRHWVNPCSGTRDWNAVFLGEA
jgi:hypothetical protein